MVHNPKCLPYFQTPRKTEEKILADFLLRKFKPAIKKQQPRHFLCQPVIPKTIDFLKKTSKKYSYFLRFDIRLYYPSINHQALLEILPAIHQKILKKPPSKRFKKHLKNGIPEFLSKSPYGKGVPVGSRLSYVLAGLFLLNLDWEIPHPFLRQNDDYLIFCKRKNDAQLLLKNVILPKLKEWNLEINEKKLKSGKFHEDKASFVGFEFYSGYIRISEEKIEEFKQKIIKITHLTKKKPAPAVIKLLNNQILGFGHYYKFASVKGCFDELDQFIRQRLRRWLIKNKDQKEHIGNLYLTNSNLKNLGLKSLTDIFKKHALKKRLIFKKLAKNRRKTDKFTGDIIKLKLEKIEFQCGQKLILNQLKELISLTKNLNKRLAMLERKLDKKTIKKSRKIL